MINAQIGPREDYTNVEIVIGRHSGEGQPYPVSLDVTNWRSFPPSQVKIDPIALEAIQGLPEEYGMTLGKALFSAETLGPYYSEVLAVCQGRGDGMRVRLLVEAEELQGVAWERLFQKVDEKWVPLGTSAVTPFSRFIQPQQWSRPMPVVERPLRVLLVISSPSDLGRASLDPIPENEREQLRSLLGSNSDLSLTILESGTAGSPTLDEIRKALAEGCQILHLLCHGVRTKAGTALFLEKPGGDIDVVTSERLVSAVKAVQSPPVFCFLTACESAARARSDAFLPLGPALVSEGGVQAVVAMTARVGMETAGAFTSMFYSRLLKHGVVDLAVNEARALVRDRWDWGVPVLFSRLFDNQLLDFPIGKIDEYYKQHDRSGFHALDEAINAARLEEHGRDLLDALQELVDEHRKTLGALVSVATDFRRTGQDPETFASQFEQFYYSFKQYYDQQTWVGEQTSISRIGLLSARILPRLAPILNDAAMDALRRELDQMTNSKVDLVRYFQEYLDTMNAAVDEIWKKLGDKEVDEAILIKRDFEAQITPSFKRSKMLFESMGRSIHGVSRA